MFFLSLTIAKKGYKYINLFMCIVSVLISLFVNIDFININYDEINLKPLQYIKEDIRKDDILLMGNEGSGFVIAVNFLENSSYFYDKEYWNSEEAYRVFSNDFHSFHDLSFLENYKGRIWIINDKEHLILEEIKENYDVNLIKQENFEIEYKTYNFAISLIEK